MPEPTVEDLNHHLAPDWIPDPVQANQLRRELTEVQQLNELFSMDGWSVLVARLQRNIVNDRADLETCPVDDVRLHRDRLKWWRYLLNLPPMTEAAIADLRTRLEEFEPEQTEEDA